MENKVALVTGSAGGIGEAVVRMLSESGAVVGAVDYDAARLGDSVDRIRADGMRAEAFPCDVDDVERRLGPIDFLVNSAGVLRLADARSLTDEDWATTFAVNTDGVFFVSRAVVNRMVPRRRGAIVTVASNAASTARVEMAAYAASKAAATMFTKSLGLEVAKHGIRCNLVSPGSTDTPMLRSMWDDDSGVESSIEGVPDAYRVGIPLGKLAEPRDVAHAVCFLLSDKAAHITLHDLTVDGGAALGV